MSKTSNKDELTLIVLEPEFADGADDDGLPADTFEEQGVKEYLGRKLAAKPKQVKLSALKERLAEVQDEVGEMLAKMKPSTGGYRLAEVTVSLAISGSGSIGVATVGAEAAIALTFAAPDRGA